MSRRAHAAGWAVIAGIALDDPAGELPVLWPHGTTLSADGLSVQIPGFGEVGVGDHLWSGGGFTSGDRIVPTLPEECVGGQKPRRPPDAPARAAAGPPGTATAVLVTRPSARPRRPYR